MENTLVAGPQEIGISRSRLHVVIQRDQNGDGEAGEGTTGSRKETVNIAHFNPDVLPPLSD